jgi:hypothetical protein
MPLNCHRVDTPTATTDRKPSYIAIATKHCPPPSTAKLRKTCPSTVRLSARIDTPQSKSVPIREIRGKSSNHGFHGWARMKQLKAKCRSVNLGLPPAQDVGANRSQTNPFDLCEPSQNGRFCEAPQRHSATSGLSGLSGNGLPF